MWKNLFYFTKKERSGLIFLTILILGLFIGKHFYSKRPNELPEITRSQAEEISARSDSLLLGERSYSRPFQRYEKKKSFVHDEKRTYFNNQQSSVTALARDTARKYPVTEKYAKGTKVDINTADTAVLMKIPGVGKAYATRILKYRQLLGGYYSVEQLKEVYGMYEELYDQIIPFFIVSEDTIVSIPINRASLEQLKAHPYINFYQAKAIVEMRKKRGPLKSVDELRLLEEFTDEELAKIKNYLSFD